MIVTNALVRLIQAGHQSGRLSMKSYPVCALVALMLASVGAVSLHAAGYPEQNIIIIVPFPSGGASDTTARLTGNKLSEIVGKPVLIENRAGANGDIGATTVKL